MSRNTYLGRGALAQSRDLIPTRHQSKELQLAWLHTTLSAGYHEGVCWCYADGCWQSHCRSPDSFFSPLRTTSFSFHSVFCHPITTNLLSMLDVGTFHPTSYSKSGSTVLQGWYSCMNFSRTNIWQTHLKKQDHKYSIICLQGFYLKGNERFVLAIDRMILHLRADPQAGLRDRQVSVQMSFV